MLSQTMIFLDINYGEYATITGTNLTTSTAIYAADNRCDTGYTAWSSSSGDLQYTFNSTVQLDTFMINNTNFGAGYVVAKNGIANILIHGNQPSGTATFTNSATNALSIGVVGTVVYTSAQAVFGSTSVYFQSGSAAGNYLMIASNTVFSIGLSDFSFYTRYRTTDYTNLYTEPVLLSYDTSTKFRVTLAGGGDYGSGTYGRVTMYIGGTSSSKVFQTNPDTWYALEASRINGIARVFIDGVNVVSFTANFTVPASDIVIGSDNGGAKCWIGYMDEIMLASGGGHSVTYSISATTFTNTGLTDTTLTTFNLTTSAYYYKHTSTIGCVGVTYVFSSTQDSANGRAGELIASKQKFQLVTNPSKYSPKLLPLGVEKRLFSGKTIWNESGDYFSANIGWSFLLGTPNTLTNTDLQNVSELARQRTSFLFWPCGGSDSINIRTYRLEDAYKCKLYDGVSYEFPSPAIDYAIVADYRIEEVK